MSSVLKKNRNNVYGSENNYKNELLEPDGWSNSGSINIGVKLEDSTAKFQFPKDFPIFILYY